MRKFYGICFTILFINLICITYAEELETVPLQKGIRELILEGSFLSRSESGTAIEIDGGWGYFIQDYVEVGGVASYSSRNNAKLLGLRGFGEYNFDLMTNWVPFAGGGLGYVSFNPDIGSSNSALELRIYGGSKVFLTDYLSITGTINLLIASDDVYADDNNKAKSVNMDFRLGLRIWY